MSGLFRIKDSLANQISYYHVMLLMASLPFDRFYSHLILISYGLHTLIHLKSGAFKHLFQWRTLVLQSVFFITVFSTFYSINRQEGLNDWGKQIVIFLFPIFFCLNPLDLKKYRAQLLLAFALVCTAAVVYLYADAFITIRHYQLPLSTLLTAAFINHNFAEPIDMHATFFSMQLIIALIYLVSLLIKPQYWYVRSLYLLCSLILTAGLIQLSSKSALMALFIIVNAGVPYFVFRGLERWKFFTLSASLSLLLIAVVLYSGGFRARILSDLKTDLSKATTHEISDGRLARWYVVAGLIQKKPLTGYGSGSEKELLQDAFYTHKLYNSYLNKLNSHSEYLSLWLKSGIIGLLVYISALVWGFKRTFKQRNLLFFTFMLLVAIVSFSENLLDVDKGIFFYAFFFSFFDFSTEGPVFRRNKYRGQQSQYIKANTDLALQKA